jgi:hypothetical protein
MSPPTPLENLSGPSGSLKAEPPDAAEIAGLLRTGSTRYIVFQALPHTLGLGPEVWRVLDLCHNKRNLGEYEGMMDVDERLVVDLIKATQQVWQALQKP